MLSQEALQEFKRIWKEEYGETISDDFAVKQAINLLTLFDVIYRPVKKSWSDDLLKNNTHYKKYEATKTLQYNP